jgi:hypothetical protein
MEINGLAMVRGGARRPSGRTPYSSESSEYHLLALVKSLEEIESRFAVYF